ncbi:Zn(II)2Cys6 transcription factor [Aspergillus affinis]|uniref:Zn(II)2Cys6 transcription factor n=1 Tax=Aspergillus affinis TaxID=1070780 RepID=UPI0022FEC9CF|nr:zinc finger protein C11D3.17 [Aspergillus affinis]KAI9044909.1 zinc finger protein C11D3.17 [Aspergillus affinis]
MSSDTLRRHMRAMHGVEEPARIKFACTGCRNQKARCQGESPCTNCVRRGLQCSLTQEEQGDGKQIGHISGSTDALSVAYQSPTRSNANRSENERHYIKLYFQLFHPYWRFIHQGSFKESDETPLLVQSMVVIGLWLSNEDNAQSRAIALHNVLSSAIYQQMGLWDASESEGACSSCSWPIPTYQAILLHIIFAILYKDRGALGLDLRPSLSAAGAELLRRLVNDLPSYVWVSIEEVKRFNIALYKVCTAYSGKECGTGVLDTIAVSSRELRAQDLQFPLPRNTPLWNAISKAEWVSAATEDVYRHTLNDTLEHEWISKSAHILEALDTT